MYRTKTNAFCPIRISPNPLVENQNTDGASNERHDDRHGCTFYKVKARDVRNARHGNHNGANRAQ